MSHQRPSWIILIHLIKDTTWPSNNKDKGAGSIIAKRREKWIQPTLAALQLFPLEIAVKKSVGARLHGKCTAFIWCIYPVSFAKPPKLLLRPLSHDKPIHTHCTYPVKGLWPCSDCQPKSVFWHIQIDFTKSGEHKTTWNAIFVNWLQWSSRRSNQNSKRLLSHSQYYKKHQCQTQSYRRASEGRRNGCPCLILTRWKAYIVTDTYVIITATHAIGR